MLYKLVPFPSPTLLVSRIRGETGLGEVKVSAVCGPAASRGWGPGLAEEPTRQQVLRASRSHPGLAIGGSALIPGDPAHVSTPSGAQFPCLQRGQQQFHPAPPWGYCEIMAVIIKFLKCMAHT